MQSVAFVERYEKAQDMSYLPTPEVSELVATSTVPAEIFSTSSEWSDAFSSLLHAHLTSGNTPDFDTYQKFASSYQNWVIRDKRASEARIRELMRDPRFAESVDFEQFTDEAMKHTFHASFHDINIGFLLSWGRLFDHSFGQTIQAVQADEIFSLAMKGCKTGAIRDGFIKDADAAAYFEPETKNGRDLVEFKLSEIDAGIVLLEFARKHPDEFIVLPAPSAFETLAGSTDHQTNANADFIIINRTTDHVIGVQVKSKVHQNDTEKYDTNRIVLLDSQVDLGNQSAKRTERHRSDRKIVNWGGLIAVESMSRVNPKSPHGKHLFATKQLGLKQYANRNMKGLSPQLAQSSQRIGERILAKI
jgi:hypothetical protein